MENRVLYFNDKKKANEFFWKLSCAMRKPHSRITSIDLSFDAEKGCYELFWVKKV